MGWIERGQRTGGCHPRSFLFDIFNNHTYKVARDLDVSESPETATNCCAPPSMNVSFASVEEFMTDPMLIPPGGSAQHLNLNLTNQQ